MKRFAAVVPALLVLAACSTDATTEPEANLTVEEVGHVFEALSEVGGFSLDLFPVAGLREAGTEMPALQEAIDETEACPRGGTTRVVGTVNVNEASGSGTLDVRQSYTNCASESENGRVWTFNGDPNVRTQLTAGISASTQQLSVTGTQKGAFLFSSNGASGRCTIDLRATLTETTYNITGKICGRTYTESGSFEF